MAMFSKDLAGLHKLIIANAKFIFPDILRDCATANNDPYIVIRYTGNSENPSYRACLIYHTSTANEAYMAYESVPKTTIDMALTLLLQKTGAAVESGFDTKVFGPA